MTFEGPFQPNCYDSSTLALGLHLQLFFRIILNVIESFPLVLKTILIIIIKVTQFCKLNLVKNVCIHVWEIEFIKQKESSMMMKPKYIYIIQSQTIWSNLIILRISVLEGFSTKEFCGYLRSIINCCIPLAVSINPVQWLFSVWIQAFI